MTMNDAIRRACLNYLGNSASDQRLTLNDLIVKALKVYLYG